MKRKKKHVLSELSHFCLAPPTVQQKMQDFEVSRGQEVTITVTADGSPLPTCTWFHNDTPIQVQPDRIVFIDDGATHSLKLLDVQLSDDGQYKVRENKFCFVLFHDYHRVVFFI